jgi:hypothetical protein
VITAWHAQGSQKVRHTSQEPFKYETQMECAIKETTSKFKQLKGCRNYVPSRVPQLHPCTLTESMFVNNQSIIHYSKKTESAAPENYYETCDTKNWQICWNQCAQ